MKILLVEDEIDLARILCAALERERLVVDHTSLIASAREAAALVSYDLALLDRTLPDGEGLSLIPSLRSARPGLPIIVLSARGDVEERINGLDEGADDYLAKPFSIDELLARIRALRRRPSDMVGEYIRAGDLVLHLSNEEVFVGRERIELPRRELRVLATLLRRRGRTVLRSSLDQAVFGFDDEVLSNTLASHISRLRRRLNDAGAGVEIHAIRGVGYLLREAE